MWYKNTHLREILKWVYCGQGWVGRGWWFFWVRIYFWYKVWKLFNKNTICTLYDKSIWKSIFIVRTVNLNNPIYIYVLHYILTNQAGAPLFYKTKTHVNSILERFIPTCMKDIEIFLSNLSFFLQMKIKTIYTSSTTWFMLCI